MREDIIGCFASSLAGHDTSTVYVIIDADAEYVYLSDGKLKTVDAPKKKKYKHVQIINKKDSEIELKHNKHINLIDEDIKRAIKIYLSRQNFTNK